MIKPKHILPILLTLAIFASCSKKPMPENNKHTFPEIEKEEPQPDLSDLKVEFSCEGLKDGHLTLDVNEVWLPIEVSVNKENLRWTVESDKDWCTVCQEEHRGSGSILLMVNANEGFSPREMATLTFVAGDYRGPKITVSQECTGLFIESRYYFLGKSACSLGVRIIRPNGETDGSFVDYSDDLGLLDILYSDNLDGTATITYKLYIPINDGPTRFYILEFASSYTPDDAFVPVGVTQFGNDIERDSYGRIILDGNVDSKLSFQFPEMLVYGFNKPDYVTVDLNSNGDGTVTITFKFPKIVEPGSGYRDSYIDCLFRSEACPYVSLPVVRQYFGAS